jgi:diguanylate cyclase (GGDEF)-like protein
MDTPSPLPRVLIVDDSRMVRATIIKRIRDHYDFREEVDGEAGWQALVLDQSIQLVISDLSMPVLDGYGLLTRIRAARLARIREIPVLMISGDDEEDAREKAKALGVSDFITKGVGTSELLARIDSLVKLAQTQKRLSENREQQVQDPDTGLFSRKYIELQTAQAMSNAIRHDGQISALILGFDRFDALRKEQGEDVMNLLHLRFSKMLAGKVRKEDSAGHFSGGQYVIVSPGTPYPACATFASRLREAIEVANITVHGQRLSLTVSIGVASMPADPVTSSAALLELACERLRVAQEAGGNRVSACDSKCSTEMVAPKLAHAMELLRMGQERAVLPHLRSLGKQVLPLLRLLERELKLGLPLAEMERKVLDEAQANKEALQK